MMGARVCDEIHRSQRKKLETEASRARVPLSPMMASWLTELRPEDVAPDAPVFPSRTGEPLRYDSVYHHVLRPALIGAGLAVKVGERQNGTPIYDYQGVGFQAFRKAAGSVLLA
jgi:hypothetical protein